MRIGQGSIGTTDVSDRLVRLVGTTRSWWLNELRAGRAFARTEGLGASVGNNSHVQLFNPAASGVTIIVYVLELSLAATGQFEITLYNTALTNLTGVGINLLNGGAAALGQLRWANNAGVLGTRHSTGLLLANTPFSEPVRWCAELGAGEGVVVVPAAVNTGMNATIYWVEF